MQLMSHLTCLATQHALDMRFGSLQDAVELALICTSLKSPYLDVVN